MDATQGDPGPIHRSTLVWSDYFKVTYLVGPLPVNRAMCSPMSVKRCCLGNYCGKRMDPVRTTLPTSILPRQYHRCRGDPFQSEVPCLRPENDLIEWGIRGLPTWLDHEEGLLTGTPTDADVGIYRTTVNVTANSKNGSLELTITVLNIPPWSSPFPYHPQLRRGMSITVRSGPMGHCPL